MMKKAARCPPLAEGTERFGAKLVRPEVDKEVLSSIKEPKVTLYHRINFFSQRMIFLRHRITCIMCLQPYFNGIINISP